jgi:Fe-Mn family superoxide dismutase
MIYETRNFDYLLKIQGLSEQLQKNHLALYQGYVANLNEIYEILHGHIKEGKTSSLEYAEVKRRHAWEFNGVRLHEYYFENIKSNGAKLDKGSNLYNKIIKDFKSYETWEKAFRATGMMRGVGWVIAYYDPLSDRIYNAWITEHDTGHFCGAAPLLVMDVFEHAYMLDYGIKKIDYIEAFFKIIDWNIIDKRFNAAKPK